MPKKKLQKLFPTPEQVRQNKSLSFLAPLMGKPNLWHINRRSVAQAFFIGVFCAFIPMPFQMALAGLLAFYFNSNLPISVGLVWLSNPITMPPLFYATYSFGAYILDIPAREFNSDMTLDSLLTELNEIWLPLYLGSILAGLICACISYVAMRIIWRMHVVSQWEKRREKRLADEALANSKD
ncbi:MAG TPA: DUF2062 domain-containing protein [Oceanospirillales bacterium]|nr:ATP-binding protein [Oleispira sp.]HCM06142.1 DUF2062 domain-containing protein [Oceanospirillales bacterium]|tara:strand:+ start:739 stop:1284 length:546 start_codon:yes stop_codon:yes gene_type:complete